MLPVSRSFNVRIDSRTVLPLAAPPINACELRIADNWAWANDWCVPTVRAS